MTVAAGEVPAVDIRGICKAYGHVQALWDVNLAVRASEVVALVGDNGAGKSTLLKVICGAVRPDAGAISICGQTAEMMSVRDADALGVGIVYQDLSLAPHLSVMENVFLGHEILSGGWRRTTGTLARRSMEKEAESALQELGINLPSMRIPVSVLSGGQQQAVAIARAVKWARNVILLDEPTAALGARQTSIVGDLIRSIAAQGLAVLLVSHDLPRALALANRVVVLRHGRVAADLEAAQTSIPEIVGVMLGSAEMPDQGMRA